MASTFTNGRFFDYRAVGLSPGAALYTYDAGTLNAAATYTDAGGLSANANPVICDVNGGADVWLNPQSYKLRLYTNTTGNGGTLIDEWDNITPESASLSDTTNPANGDALVGVKRVSTGSVATTVHGWIERQAVSLLDFGAIGDGSDESTKISNAINAAIALGVPLVCEGTKTYTLGTSFLTIAAGLRLITNGCTFSSTFTTTSNTVWLTLGDNCVIDELRISIPTGVRRDRVISIGSGCQIGFLQVSSVDQQATAESNDFAVRVLSASNVRIGEVRVTNYDRAVTIQTCTDVEIEKLNLTSYVRGLYILDSSDVKVNRAHMRTASANALYTPGHNGVLISCDTVGATHDITLSDFHIEDVGEHGVRVGGPEIIKSVYLVRTHVKTAGGCGIKLLGTDSGTPTNRNETIFIIDPVIEDCGSGVLTSNMCGIVVLYADAVKVTNPTIRKVSKTYSSYAGIRFAGCDDLSITNPGISDAQFDGIFIDGSMTSGDVARLRITGGVSRSNGQDGLRLPGGTNTYRRFNIDGLALDTNGRYGFNLAAGGGATFVDCLLKVKTYSNTSGAGACDTAAVFMDVFGLPGATAIAGITAGNGSVWHDQTTLNYRKAGAWVAL